MSRPGQNEEERHPEGFVVGERILAHKHLRKDIVAGILPMRGDGFGEVCKHLQRRCQIRGFTGGGRNAQFDDGVLPSDELLSILQRQTEQR